LQARLRGHRVKAAWLTISVGAVVALIKVKNPKAPAVTREAEEDLGALTSRLLQSACVKK
jgi:hypothetical protein